MNIEYDKIHSRQDSMSFQEPEQLLSENMILNKNFGCRKEETMLQCKVCLTHEQQSLPCSNMYTILINDTENVIKPCKCKGYCHEGCLIMWVLKTYFIKCPQCDYVFNLSLDKTITNVAYDNVCRIVKFISLFFILLVLSFLSFFNVVCFEKINAHWCVIIGIIFLTLSVFSIQYMLDSKICRKSHKYFFQIKLRGYKEENAEDDLRISSLSNDFQLFLFNSFKIRYDELTFSIRDTLLKTHIQFSERKLAKFIDLEQRHVSNGLRSELLSSEHKSLKASAKSLLWSFKDKSKLQLASKNLLSTYVPYPSGPSYQNFIGNKNLSFGKDPEKEYQGKEIVSKGKGTNNNYDVINYVDVYKENNISQKQMFKMDLAHLNVDEIKEVDFDYSEMNSPSGSRKGLPKISIMNANTIIKGKIHKNSVQELININNKKKFNSTRLDFKPQSFVMNYDGLMNFGSRIVTDKRIVERCASDIKTIIGKENFGVNSDLEINLKVRNSKNFNN